MSTFHNGRALVKARDIMQRSVLSVGEFTTAADALCTLDRQDYSTAPVLDDDGHLIGTVSRERLAAACASFRPNPRHLLGRRSRPPQVGLVMDSPAVGLTPGAELDQVVTMLEQVPAVLVIDGWSVVGIIGAADLPSAARQEPEA